MRTTKAHRRLTREQRSVRDDVTTCELGLDDGAVALAAGVAAGADRAQHPTVGFSGEAEAVEELTPQRDSGDAGEIVLSGGDHRMGDLTPWSDDDLVRDLEQGRGSLHRTGAPLLGDC